MIKIFRVLSSDGVTLYSVAFEFSGSKLTVQCDCPAGILGKSCKHKLSLLAGTNMNLIDAIQLNDYREVMAWVRKSQIPNLIEQVSLSERGVEQAKKKLNEHKKLLEKALRG